MNKTIALIFSAEFHLEKEFLPQPGFASEDSVSLPVYNCISIEYVRFENYFAPSTVNLVLRFPFSIQSHFGALEAIAVIV